MNQAQPPLPLPPCDDRRMWEVWMSIYQFSTLTTADDLGLFPLLEKRALPAEEAGRELKLSPRAAEALLGAEVTRHFLLPSSPYSWGVMLRFIRDVAVTRASLKEVLLKDRPRDGSREEMWETHEMKSEQAKAFTAALHTRSLHLGVAAAERANFRGVRKLLDVAGDSGCFSIALARRHPEMRCTVLELASVAGLASGYIAEFGVQDRVDTLAPTGSGTRGRRATTRSSSATSPTTGTGPAASRSRRRVRRAARLRPPLHPLRSPWSFTLRPFTYVGDARNPIELHPGITFHPVGFHASTEK